MLTKLERETIILFNEEEATAVVYTHNKRIISKLRRMALKFPEKVYPEQPEHPGAVSFIVPKKCVSIREPYDERRREAVSEWSKKAGIRPPQRKEP